MRRVLLLCCVLSILGAPHAIAAPASALDVEIDGLQRGSVVEGTLSFTARASSPAGIKKLEIYINDTKVAMVEPSGVKQEADVGYDWITNFVPDSAELAPNGEYTVSARAVGNGDGEKIESLKVIVDNAPAAPTGLSAVIGDEGVQLSWQANSEPDLLGYVVERWDGANYVGIAQTIEASYVDPVDDGTFAYRIVAVRSSAARSSGRPSLPSEPVEITSETAGAVRSDTPPTDGVFGGRSGGAGKAFAFDAESFAPSGLPGGVALPGSVGLPDAPEGPVEWGTFEKELPYELPEGGVPLSAQLEDSDEGWSLMPTDGLRWVAAGALLLALAMLMKVLAQRLDDIAGPPELKL